MNRRSLLRITPLAVGGVLLPAAPAAEKAVEQSVDDARLLWLAETAETQTWDAGYRDCAAALRELMKHRRTIR
jgi:hypothetical protein